MQRRCAWLLAYFLTFSPALYAAPQAGPEKPRDDAPAGEAKPESKGDADRSDPAKPAKREDPKTEDGKSEKGEEEKLPESPDKLVPSDLPTSGTFIHVLNGTKKTLEFTLYVECAKGGTGKFDRNVRLPPGDTAVWRLASEHKVVMATHKGATYYRVGLVGRDLANGKEYRWGVVGGPGMHGKERTTDAGGAVSRHIHVQPITE